MIRIQTRHKQLLSSAITYIAVLTAVIAIASQRLRTSAEQMSPSAKGTFVTTEGDVKPFFSLSTHRTYGTGENARIWLSYRAIDNLDFRVYRINEPDRFFANLENPHQLGQDENEEIASNLKSHPSLL